ncbi:partial Globin-coupled histidine kinase, partial [Methylacidimicrobium cyclopophantes]
MEARAAWNIRGEEILTELEKLLTLTLEERAILPPLEVEARAELPAFLEEFYGRILGHPQTREYFQDEATIERVRGEIGQWFVTLFSGPYDAAYLERRLRIGEIHVRIGLPVRYPLAMFDILLRHGERVAENSSDPEMAKSAFRKVLALDIALFTQAYENRQ